MVERHPIDALPKLAAEGVTVAVLKFWRRPAVATEASNSRSMGAGAANTFSGCSGAGSASATEAAVGVRESFRRNTIT